MMLHYIFLLAYIFLSLFFSSKVLSGILVIHSLVVMFRYLHQKKPLDPLFFFCIYMVFTSIANIFMIERTETDSVSRFYDYIIPEKIDTSIMIWCVGTTFIFIGYEFFEKKSFANISLNISKPASLRLLYYSMLILSVRTLFLVGAALGSIGTMLSVFASIGIVFFSRLWAKYDNKTYRNYALTLFVLQTVFALLYAILRADILMPTLAIFTGYFLGKGKLKYLLSFRILPFVVAFIAFNSYFAMFGANRSNLSRGFGRISELRSLTNQDNFYTEEEKENISERASILPQLTNVVNLVDTRGFFNGDASAILLIALVPRIIWPEKPLIGLGAWFATEIDQGRQTDSWYSNSINMTIPGHLYLDFGFLGVAIGCFLVGALLVAIWNSTRFYESPYNISGITLGGFLILSALQGIGADLQITITLFAFYLIFYVLKKVV